MESEVHQQLVKSLVHWIKQHVHDATNAAVFCELPMEGGGNKPPLIGGFTPDMLCKVAGTQGLWIGEAKTAGDLDTQHSREQFKAFLAHLAQNGSGTLVIAVPWRVVRYAKSLIRLIQRQSGTSAVEVVYLDQLPG